MSGVTLHPKFGVNPCISQCWWCGQDKNEIALLGIRSERITGHDEAPHHCVLDLQPCDHCREGWALGILIMEGDTVPHKGWQEVYKGQFVSGQIVVIKEEAVKRMLTEDVLEGVLKSRKCIVDSETYDKLGLPRSNFDIRDQDKK